MSDGRSFRAYFTSEHLRGVDLPEDGHTFRITAETQTTMEDGKTACMLTLRDAEADGITWITNITNGEYMKRIFGSERPEDWVGHLVTLRYDPTVRRGKEVVGGIRVMGSPEMTRPVTFQYQENSRKKPRDVTLVPTGKAAQ